MQKRGVKGYTDPDCHNLQHYNAMEKRAEIAKIVDDHKLI
jgi:hypothetical protein